MSPNATVTVTYQGKSVTFDLEGTELNQGSDHQYLSTASQGYITREVEKALIEVSA